MKRLSVNSFVFLILVGVITTSVVADTGVWDTTTEGCKVWNGNPQPNETITWSGACVDGYASGSGVQRWEFNQGDARVFSVYEGEMYSGKLHGQGMFRAADGTVYQGEYKDGRRHGYGRWKGNNGARYEGESKAGLRHGHGVYVWPNGDRYVGQYERDQRHGKGVFVWATGDQYEGEFVSNRFQGEGVFMWSNDFRFDGTFENGVPHGIGRCRERVGDWRQCEFFRGELVR